MTPRFSGFPPGAVPFLRALKRNNNRDWFRQRKEQYELLLRAPMAALVERLAGDLRPFAPELIADPKRCLFRIYRDTRFSADKRPLKTNVAAHFPSRELTKGCGAGLYLEVAPEWVWIGGGMYSPESWELNAVREHIAAHSRQLRAIVASPSFRRTVGELEGEQLQRVPRGYDKDHEAAEYLKRRQFIAGKEFPASLASSPRMYSTVVSVFREVAPLVQFLNAPLKSVSKRQAMLAV